MEWKVGAFPAGTLVLMRGARFWKRRPDLQRNSRALALELQKYRNGAPVNPRDDDVWR